MQVCADFDCCLAIEWKFYMVVNFGMRINLSLLQTSVNDHWHCIFSDTRVSGDSLTEAARDEDIDLESGEYVPVGHIWKFDLERHEYTWFSSEVLFFKISNEACHAQFSRDNWKHKIRNQNDRIYNCGKVLMKTAGNYYSQFPDTK